MNTGGTSTTYNKITTYDGISSTHTLYTTVPSDGISQGQIYKFKYRAVNSYGESDYSDEVDGGISSFPATPSAPTKLQSESGETFITLQWAQSANTELPVIGYVLNMDDGYGGSYTQVYNGKNYPNVLKYTLTGLNTGLTYKFTL